MIYFLIIILEEIKELKLIIYVKMLIFIDLINNFNIYIYLINNVIYIVLLFHY